MTPDASARRIRLLFTIDGAPAAGRNILIDSEQSHATDAEGAIIVALGTGKHCAEIENEEPVIRSEFVIAAGVSELLIRMQRDRSAIDDPRLLEAMPSDRYRPIELLGRGAVGSVYRCRDLTLERDVAIKLLDQGFTSSADEREAFLNEGRALAAIEHPNLIAIYDLGFHNERGFMVMQYVDGPDLDRYLQANGRLEYGALAAVGVQLARGLEALHRNGLLHRDVKPSNGILDHSGLVRVADFGLVRPLADFTDPRSQVYGTPAYMSPEQLQALPLGPASDVYGLGATLYHLATGSLPYDGDNVIVNHVTAPPPDLKEKLPDAPEMLAELLRWMLAKTPESRPSAGEIAGALSPLATRLDAGSNSPYEPRLDSDGTTPSASGRMQRTLLATPSSHQQTPTSDPPEVPDPPPPAPSDDLVAPPASRRRRAGFVIAALALAGAAAALLTQGDGGAEHDPVSTPAAAASGPPGTEVPPEPDRTTPTEPRVADEPTALAAVPDETPPPLADGSGEGSAEPTAALADTPDPPRAPVDDPAAERARPARAPAPSPEPVEPETSLPPAAAEQPAEEPADEEPADEEPADEGSANRPAPVDARPAAAEPVAAVPVEEPASDPGSPNAMPEPEPEPEPGPATPSSATATSAASPGDTSPAAAPSETEGEDGEEQGDRRRRRRDTVTPPLGF